MEWAAPAATTEIFSIQDLPRFESTDFTYLLEFVSHKRTLERVNLAGVSQSLNLLKHKHSKPLRPSVPPDEQDLRSVKRRRLDAHSLHSVIPQVNILSLHILYEC